jgi:hypothetical protein
MAGVTTAEHKGTWQAENRLIQGALRAIARKSVRLPPPANHAAACSCWLIRQVEEASL